MRFTWTMAAFCVWVISMMSACSTNDIPAGSMSGPEFSEICGVLRDRLPEQMMIQEKEKRVTISALDMPLSEFLRFVSNHAGVSVVAEQGIDTQPVTVDVEDEPVSAVLGVVARRLDVQLTRSGTLYFLGDLRPEDKGVLVRKVTRLDEAGLTSAVSVLLSEFGEVTAFSDGLVVVGDRVEVLQRIDELLDRIEAAPSESWVVQLHLISMTDAAVSEFGLDVEPTLDIAATFGVASGGSADPETAAHLAGGLTAMLRASRQSESINAEAEPLFVIVDGETATMAIGEEVPIPNVTTIPETGVTQTDYEFIQTGLEVEVSIRDQGEGRARVDVMVSMSDVVGMVLDAPVVQNQEFDTSAVVSSSGVYLIGSLTRDSERETVSGPFGGLRGSEDERDRLDIWLRTYRISPLLPSSVPPDGEPAPADESP